MRKWIVGLGAVVGLFVVVAVAIPIFVPKETVKDQIIEQLESATGWRLRIDGDVNVSALPFLKLSAEDVGLGGEAGADGIEFVTLREIRFGLSLTALLTGVVEVTGVTLVEPNLFLETDPAGRTSWAPRRDLPGLADQPPQPRPEEAGAGDAPAAFGLDRLRFGAVEIRDGLAVWDDRRAGRKVTISRINVTASMPSLGDAARVGGDITWNGIDIAFDVGVAEPLALAENRQTSVEAEISTGKGTVRADGVLTAGPVPAFDGRIDASADSLRELLASLDIDAPKMAGLAAFDLKTGLSYGKDGATLSDFTLRLDDTTMTGSLTAALAGDRPSVTGAFAVDKIDLDRFRPKGKEKKQASEPRETAPDAPIDLAPLRAADIDLGLRIGALSGGGVEISGVDGRIRVADGKLDLDLAETRLFGGTASLALAADGRGDLPAFSGKLRSSGLSIVEMMKLAGRKDPITGTIHTDLNFATKGDTVAALAGALALSGIAGLTDGGVGGLGLAGAFGGDKRANRIDGVTINARIAGLGDPIDVTGGLDWRGERFDISARATPSALAAGAPSPVSVRVRSDKLTLGFDGRASSSGKVDGKVLVETPSVRKLAGWLGNPLPKGRGLEAFKFSGALAYTGNTLSFKQAKLSLDGTEGTGSGRIALGGAVPSITATLALDTLKLDPYLAGGGKAAGKGGGGNHDWSTEPIDFSGLRAVNADLDLSAKAIHWDKLKIGATKLAIKLAGGKLTTELSQFKLYDGDGTGKLVLDGAGKTAAVDADFKLSKVSAYPLLRDAAGFDHIEGAGNLDIALKTSGRSERDFVSALNGSAGFDFRDGAVRGINIAQMMRSLSVDVLLGWQENKAAKTDFSVFTSKFKIDKGIAKSTAFRLIGPLVRVGGGGTVDMPRQHLDWKVDPKVVPTLEGQTRKKGKKTKNNKDRRQDGEMVGLGVPVIIKGPWSDPKIYPDIKGILSNPQAAYDSLKKMGGGLLGGGALGAVSGKGIDGILGGKGGKGGNALDQATKSLGLDSLTGQSGNKKKRGKGKNAGGNKNKGNSKTATGDSESLRDIDSIFKQLE